MIVKSFLVLLCLAVIASDSISEEQYLTVPQLIEKHGYPVELQQVETADGYILELHRIPKPGGRPVYVLHGLLDSSAAWILNGPGKALGYILSDLGYDVWLGNARGNLFSQKHKTLNVKSKEFWDFSFPELGRYDLPAIIDKITNVTQFEKIHYIGHSQGTTSFFVMCNEFPEYCDKILSMNAFGPVAYLKHLSSPIFKLLATFDSPIEFLANFLHIYNIDATGPFAKWMDKIFCSSGSIFKGVCSNILFLVNGYDAQQMNMTLLPLMMAHSPAGGSVKQLVHFSQLYKTGEFKQFDYGKKENLKRYGTEIPPSYDLGKVTAPVYLHYGNNDQVAAKEDVEKIIPELPNVKARMVPFEAFNHIDFAFAVDGKTLLYDEVVRNLKSHDNDD